MIPNIPAEPVSMELSLIIFGLFSAFSFLTLLLGFFVKRWFQKSDEQGARILRKLDYLEKQRTDCRETLPERFADRKEVKKGFDHIWKKIDEHSVAIKAVEINRQVN